MEDVRLLLQQGWHKDRSLTSLYGRDEGRGCHRDILVSTYHLGIVLSFFLVVHCTPSLFRVQRYIYI